MALKKIKLPDNTVVDVQDSRIPAPSSSDNSKVLGVTNTSGTLGWVEQSGSDDAVLYTLQSLTDAQKAQARENIGASEEFETVQTQALEIIGKDFRLIASGTVAEDVVGISIDRDGNNNPLALSEVIVYAKIYGNSAGYESWIKANIICTSGTQQTGELAWTFPAANDTYESFLIRFRRVGNHVLPVSSYRSQNNTSVKDALQVYAWMYAVLSLEQVSGDITGVSITGWGQGAVGAGSYYEVYGIDA